MATAPHLADAMNQPAHPCRSGLEAPTIETAGAAAVRYSATGHLLVVGPSPEQMEQLQQADWGGTLTACCAANATGTADNEAVRTLSGRVVDVQGWLGRFQVRAVDRDDQPISGMSSKGSGHFDLIIDCGPEALLAHSVPPFGYFRVDPDGDLRPALESAAALIGNFSKPKYFHYQPEICAHHSFGQTGCTRCLEVCGAAAIRSSGQKIEVNPYLCQGCGSCTLACPTGALSFAEPKRATLLESVRQLAAEKDGNPGPLIVSDQIQDDPAAASTHLVVAPLTAFGEELWIAALALGFDQVVLQSSRALDPLSQDLLETKLAEMRRMLPALGLPETAVVFNGYGDSPTATTETATDDRLARSAFESALNTSLPGQTKRELLNAGLAALAKGHNGAEGADLKDGSALGEIQIDPQRCTLCSSCAKLCPTGAIDYSEREQAGTARLTFLEANCVQCGICASGCPERAITLAPRLATAEIRLQRRVVASSPMAECSDCGAQFAAEKLLTRTLERLAEHDVPAAALEQAVRCPRCRAIRIG